MKTWMFNPAAWWRRRLRKLDHEFLFTSIRAQSGGNAIDAIAAEAILLHILIDHAWLCDPLEYSDRDVELIHFVRRNALRNIGNDLRW